MKFSFKNWYKINTKGNVHIPILAIGFNKQSLWIGLLGFSLSIWKETKGNG